MSLQDDILVLKLICTLFLTQFSCLLGKSSVRPFKQYPNPKDSMSMPGWCSAFLPTGLPPTSDSSLMDTMKMQEQMLLAYKQVR